MLAQRRRSDRNHIQPVIQILPEFARLDRLLQVLVGRSDHPRVERQQAVSSQPFEFALLQHPQQLGLQQRSHLPDFVEEQRPVLGRLRTCPSCTPTAPVNAPFSWPNNSLSSKASGMAAQLMATNGLSGRKPLA